MDIFQLICFVSIITYDYSKFEIIPFFFNNNWSHNLIKRISFEYQDNNNNEEVWESLLNITFPGIIEGCDCTLYNGNIYDEKCVTSLLIENCETIFPIQKTYLNILYLPQIETFTNNGIKIKVERYNDLTYLDLLNNTENNKNYFIDKNCICPKYSKICVDCGIIDSIGNHLCITSNEGLNNNCYKLKLEYDFSLKNIKLITDFEKIFNNNDESYLQYPISFINIFDNQTCILEDESITSPSIDYRLIYFNNDTSLFINGPKNQGCNTKLFYDINYDYRWHNIYSFPIKYIIDDEMKKRLKLLPGFPYDEYIDNNFTLAYRTYIGFEKHCINDIQFIMEDLPIYQKTIKITFIVFLFCALVVFPYYLLLIMVIVQTDLLFFYQNFFLGASYATIIAVFMNFLITEYDNTKNKYDILYQIANKYCGDNLTNNLFFSILKEFKIIKNSIHYSIYWTIIMFILSLIKIVLIITKSYKKRIMFTLNNGNQNPIGNHNYNIITEVEMQLLN